MLRYGMAGLLLMAMFLIGLHPSGLIAAEVTLRMKGGAFEMQGELKSFDGKTFIIKSPGLGMVEMDSSRFECIGEDCPQSTGNGIVPQITGAAIAPYINVGELGRATFIGGSAIGTQFIPELVASYAAANGLTLEKSIGRDDRDLVFTLISSDGTNAGTLTVMRRGEDAAMSALLNREVDLVWSSRPIAPREAAAFTSQGLDLRAPGNEHVFALDALVVLVHRDNPIVSLTTDAIANIFSGRFTDWSELGSPPGPIKVYAPVETMGTWATFEDTILKPRRMKLKTDAARLPTAVEWSDAVAADPNGIGFNMIAYVRDAKALNIEQSCGLISRPSIFSAKTEEFPLSRRLYFYSRGKPRSRLARELLAFALSSRAQEALTNAKFVDQAPELIPFREQGGRIAYALNAQDQDFRLDLMRDLLSDISKASRLSTTFRFAIGSAYLDSKAEEDVRRLANVLNEAPYRGRTVLLLGFADAAGRFEINQEVSLARAQRVAKALKEAGYSGGVAKAYGELAPVACNDNPDGRYLNRRVEVWVK